MGLPMKVCTGLFSREALLDALAFFVMALILYAIVFFVLD
jgi:hypothetical protein